jgi:serine protease Do
MEQKRKFKTTLLSLLVAGALVASGYGIAKALKPCEIGTTLPPCATAAASTPAVSNTAMVPANFSDLAEKVRPGVVNIQVVKRVKNIGLNPHDFFGGPFGQKNPFGDFFGPFSEGNPPRGFQQQGVGSGFVMSEDGYIVTNNHVVENADKIKVKFASGKEFTAKVIGRDRKTDLALIKIEGASDLHPLKLGNSDSLKVGSWVVAVGSPFGLEQTVTVGIVSAKGRVIGSGPYDNFIQTDASINPGNSGGPLINMNGEVVGINTAIIPNGQGIGFAIPVNMAKEIAPQLQKNGHVIRGWLGVSVQEVTPELAKSFGLKENKGALVAEVFKGTPAEKAGIEQGDIILGFNGKDISESKELPRMLASTPVGEKVTIKLLRNGSINERMVKVGEMEEEKAELAEDSSRKSLGLTVQDVTPEIAQELGLEKEDGVVVTGVEPGSPASDAGIQTGDVIRSVNQKPVRDVADFVNKAKSARGQENILLLVQRGKNNLYAALSQK